MKNLKLISTCDLRKSKDVTLYYGIERFWKTRMDITRNFFFLKILPFPGFKQFYMSKFSLRWKVLHREEDMRLCRPPRWGPCRCRMRSRRWCRWKVVSASRWTRWFGSESTERKSRFCRCRIWEIMICENKWKVFYLIQYNFVHSNKLISIYLIKLLNIYQ